MKFWPMSTLAQSPLMPFGYAGEFYALFERRAHGLSTGCVQAVAHVATQTPPHDMPNMVLVQAADTPAYRIFLDIPTPVEWHMLERAGVTFEDGDELMNLVIAPLH